MNDGGIKLRLQNAPCGGNVEFNAFGEAVDVRLQRAKFIAQRFWQHGDDSIHEVGGIAPPACFLIQGCPGANIVRNIGNMDPKLPPICSEALQANSVVEIFGVVRIDGDDQVGRSEENTSE